LPYTASEQAVVRLIRYRREVLKLSRAKLASMAGVSPAWVERVETGVGKPGSAVIAALCKALDIDEFTRISVERQAFLYHSPWPEGRKIPVQAQLEVDTHPHPACHQAMPSFGIVASNAQYRMHFPGIDQRKNGLEWFVLEPYAKQVLPYWEMDALIVVQWFKTTSGGLLPDDERQDIIDRCSKSPQWKWLWETDLPPSRLLQKTIVIKHPITKEERQYWVQITEARYPRLMPWMMWKLLPMDVAIAQAEAGTLHTR
jgi:transcriptional regulator with XRE-family HTH domain